MRALGTALVLVAGVLRVAAGAIAPGELIVFVSYSRNAHGPMRSLAREATKIAAAMARAERVAELLAADEVLEERPGAYRGDRARRRRRAGGRVVRLRAGPAGAARRLAADRRGRAAWR